jgi:hypothetical protein
MAQVKCSIDEEGFIGNDGRTVQGVIATRSKCGHSTESFGTEENSVRRCLALMREECPEKRRNFYVADE